MCGRFSLEIDMVKMKSDRPLLVGGVACTEFETNEQHARELEAAGRAVREPADPGAVVDAASTDAPPAVAAVPAMTSESIAAPKPKKVK